MQLSRNRGRAQSAVSQNKTTKTQIATPMLREYTDFTDEPQRKPVQRPYSSYANRNLSKNRVSQNLWINETDSSTNSDMFKSKQSRNLSVVLRETLSSKMNIIEKESGVSRDKSKMAQKLMPNKKNSKRGPVKINH